MPSPIKKRASIATAKTGVNSKYNKYKTKELQFDNPITGNPIKISAVLEGSVGSVGLEASAGYKKNDHKNKNNAGIHVAPALGVGVGFEIIIDF